MSNGLVNLSRLKPEIRLAQAISHFEADLSSDQKASLRAYRSQIQNAPPDPSDVMRLTAEIDRAATRRCASRRCFGPRMTNFLHAVQQFAAIGDVMIGGSQNLIACGVWSLVRMLLLVSPLYLIYGVLLNTSVVGCNHVFLPRKVIQSPYECWPIGSPLPKHRLTLSPI
jgi:hypothetical protein